MKRWPTLALIAAIAAPATAATLTGPAAFGDWRADAPGVVRKITVADLPPDKPAPLGLSPSSIAPQPAGATLHTLPGFTVTPFAKLEGPRQVRVAPNGDIFVAESQAGRIRVLRAADGAAAPSSSEIFADGLDRPFGIAFYPAGPNPAWVYIGNSNSVVRFPYKNGDLHARGPAQVIVPVLASKGGNHITRDIVFSPDNRTMFVSVGSASNAGEDMPKKNPADTAAWQASHALGAAWGRDENRADVLAFSPDGKGEHTWATGIRNCVTMAIHSATNALWCVTNERDLLGDNLPPDYATQVKNGGFYGWPWYYIGPNQDPRHPNERPDLVGKITIPDVLFQAHSAPLGLAFYEATSGPSAFPAEYRGDGFVALHGSWNRSKRTGYKIVRMILHNGRPTGEYEDFVTGFVVDDKSVWGRPVGVAVAHDGALIFTDDAGNTVWRVAYAAPH
ncbi:MAG TPA: PQQ-dependent sugar dehydrogenase [Caulobacteraceae bacterium]|jgi:hypothetical protein|nr:PQQ-dependent sugar dehydrogenase [Caulobacteraceae bacterium]